MILMLRRAAAWPVFLTAMVAAGGPVWAGVAVELNGDQLTWQAEGQVLGSGRQWLQVQDLAAGDSFLPVTVEGTGLQFRGTAADLAFEGEWRPQGEAMELTCRVVADPARDRAVIVRVALPLQAVGWRWWDDIGAPRGGEAGKHYDRLTRWGEVREVSAYPCCAVTGPTLGVSTAVPVHEPQVFRLAYDAARQALEAEFDLGLSPDAKKSPCRAEFRLLAYTHDPQWGFRSAIEEYYKLFPAYETRRAGTGGIWLIGLKPGTMACPWDWGFRFEEHGLDHAGYDNAHDIQPFVYTECWGIYEGFGNKPPPDGKDRYGRNVYLLKPNEMRQAIYDKLQVPPEQKLWGPVTRREAAQAEINSAIEDRNGQWVWSHYTQTWSPGDFLSNVCLNPDPDLPKPSRNSVTWEGEILPAYQTARDAGGDLGGVYLDSVCSYVGFSDENYRREHWQYADTPLVASYETKAPAQLHAFSCFEISQQIAERMHAEGRLVIGNTGPPEMTYWIPLLDMIGGGEASECGASDDGHYRYLRFCGYHKPISWMQYGFVDPARSWEEKERGMHRCLFYAVHPGTASFDDPAKYEPSRPLYRYYEPLIALLDEAGWQPVTRARTDTPGVLIERYGPAWNGLTYVALRNPGKDPVHAAMTVDASALPAGERLADLVAWQLISDQPAKPSAGAQALTLADIPIPGDRTEVVALAPRDALARLWLNQAQQWLDRTAREAVWLQTTSAGILANADFEGGLANWGLATPPDFTRDADGRLDEEHPLSGKRGVVFISHGDRALHALDHSLTLPAGEEYTLRFRYAWQQAEGHKGSVVPRFGVKGPDGSWAPDKYIYFRDVQPTGEREATYESKFTIPDGHSAGFFQFQFEGGWGTVRLDDVAITSAKMRAATAVVERLEFEARKAADALQARLQPGAQADLLSLAAAQRPVYEGLRSLAEDLPDGHQKRCLLLPVLDLAEALGRATEVLTGVTVHLADSPPFGDAGLGAPATASCAVSAGDQTIENLTVTPEGETPTGEGVDLKPGEERSLSTVFAMPKEAVWDWEDVYATARFVLGGRELAVTRRATLRLHPPLQVEAAGGVLSAVRAGVSLQVRSWVPLAGNPQLTGVASLGDQQISLAPVSLRLEPGVLTPVELPLPAALTSGLDEIARRGGKLRLSYGVTADGGAVKGEAEMLPVRGAPCPRLGAAPTVDGRLGAEEWRGASRLEGFVTPDDASPAKRPTTVLLGHDGAKLYIAMICGGQGQPVAEQRAHDGEVWRDDCVEVLVQPPGSEAYYHFAANAAGSQMESRCVPGSEQVSWDCDWEAKAGAAGDGWLVEMAIPLAALGAKAEGFWRMNFGREEADTKTPTCWSPTGGGFHVPQRFGDVRF